VVERAQREVFDTGGASSYDLRSMAIAELLAGVLGGELPIEVRAYDGSRVGPVDPPAALVLRTPNALRRMVTAPGELGLGRAYVAGDLDVEGDVFAVLSLHKRIDGLRLSPRQFASLLQLVGVGGLRPLPPPPEEARLRGRPHTRARDAAAISFHYDMSNDFYELLLGPSLTYSCAVWSSPTITLEAAQAAKHELVCRKLGLEPGMRLLDVGCGWGSMLLHAARHHGVRGVGVTLSREQAELGAKRVAEAGLSELVEIRFQDYRDVHDGPYDAISSIGMFEHVGLSQLETYFSGLFQLLRPGGRLLNHGISRAPGYLGKPRPWARGFIDSYVFPDGELHEVGTVVHTIQERGFEVRHVESLREHYPLTLRAWLANLEANWDDAVALIGEVRTRVWRLYVAASTVRFEDNAVQVHQVLAVKPNGGASGIPLRPDFTAP
jgi:cyclopropane-fatty-acyl-phospholipid synthase